MVQIIPNNQRRSFGEQVLAGLNEAAPGIQQYFQQQQQQQQQEMQMQQENQTAKQLGLDLSGIADPKTRQQMFSLAMQGGNQKQLEMLKQQGKQQQINQKQEFLSQLFGGGQQQPAQGMNGQSQEGEMNQGYNPLKISDADIAQASAVDPNLGRLLQQQKDVALREQRAERDFQERQKAKSPETQREQQVTKEQASADVKYNQTLQEASKQHELKEQTLDRLEKLNKKGVTGKPYEKLLEKAGLVALTSEGRREFAADVKNLITDIRSILGAQFTGFEFQTILNAYPSPDFSKGANTSIIKNLKEFQDIKKKEVEFAQKLKKENNGKVPLDFQSKVNEMVRDYAASRLPEIKENTRKIMAEEYGIKQGNVLMLDPSGEPLDVSPEDVERYEALGATLP